MPNLLDPADVDGHLMALQLVVRALAKQVAALSDGEAFLETELARSQQVISGLSAAIAMVEDMPEATRRHVDAMLQHADKHVAGYFAEASVNIGPILRH